MLFSYGNFFSGDCDHVIDDTVQMNLIANCYDFTEWSSDLGGRRQGLREEAPRTIHFWVSGTDWYNGRPTWRVGNFFYHNENFSQLAGYLIMRMNDQADIIIMMAT